MKIQLPQYSGKDNLVMMGIVPAFAISINSLIFGAVYFHQLENICGATMLSSVPLLPTLFYAAW
jgi:hypothetical protein